MTHPTESCPTCEAVDEAADMIFSILMTLTTNHVVLEVDEIPRILGEVGLRFEAFMKDVNAENDEDVSVN